MRGTTTLVAATSLAILAVAGCSAGANNGDQAQSQKGEGAAPAPPGPGTDPHATARAYGDLIAEFIGSRGEKLNGQAVASEDDARKGFMTLACPQLAESQLATYERFARMRAKHPDPNDKYWAGIQNSRAEVKSINVTGESGTADLEMVTVQGNSMGKVALQKANGKWEVCLPPGQPGQPGQQPGA